MKKISNFILRFMVAFLMVLVVGNVSLAADNAFKSEDVISRGGSAKIKEYYIDDEKLYHIDPATGTVEELASVAGEWYLHKDVVAVTKHNVYITGTGDMYIDGNETLKTYVYSISERRIIKTYNCSIDSETDGYVLSNDEYDSGMNPHPISIYKLTPQGMKKVRTLSKRSRFAKIIGKGKNKRIIYSSYPKNYNNWKMTIYSIKLNGKGKKKLVTMKPTSKNCRELLLVSANSKYCKVFRSDAFYKYVYKDKKYIKLY